MSKLPGEIHLITSKAVGEESWELCKLLETLEHELQACERAAVDTSAPQMKTSEDSLISSCTADWRY